MRFSGYKDITKVVPEAKILLKRRAENLNDKFHNWSNNSELVEESKNWSEKFPL